jgi:4-amino-4-deoxy-L-arabinose transferase-like glycosyltransferase
LRGLGGHSTQSFPHGLSVAGLGGWGPGFFALLLFGGFGRENNAAQKRAVLTMCGNRLMVWGIFVTVAGTIQIEKIAIAILSLEYS